MRERRVERPSVNNGCEEAVVFIDEIEEARKQNSLAKVPLKASYMMYGKGSVGRRRARNVERGILITKLSKGMLQLLYYFIDKCVAGLQKDTVWIYKVSHTKEGDGGSTVTWPGQLSPNCTSADT